MIILTLMQAVKPNVDKGDLFMSRFLLVFALLVATFLIGYMLIILAKRVIVVINAFSAPSKLDSTREQRFQAKTDSRDPWAESANRISPAVFMPGGQHDPAAGQADDPHGHTGHGRNRGYDPDHGKGQDPTHRDDLGSDPSNPGDSNGPSDTGGGSGGDSGGGGGGSGDSGSSNT